MSSAAFQYPLVVWCRYFEEDTGKDIASAIRVLRDRFLSDQDRDLPSVEDINNGHCHDFADELMEQFGGERWETYTENSHSTLPDHVWLKWKGRHYDAEHPEGVIDWRDLKIFREHRAEIDAAGENAAMGSLRAWFRQSKVVDDKGAPPIPGKPLVVYHGTGNEFETFSPGRHYFARSRAEAEAYGERIIEALIRIENPFVPEDTDSLLFPDDDFIAELQAKGHDGIIGTFLSAVTDSEETIYVVFDSTQIAEGNGDAMVSTWDRERLALHTNIAVNENDLSFHAALLALSADVARTILEKGSIDFTTRLKVPRKEDDEYLTIVDSLARGMVNSSLPGDIYTRRMRELTSLFAEHSVPIFSNPASSACLQLLLQSHRDDMSAFARKMHAMGLTVERARSLAASNEDYVSLYEAMLEDQRRSAATAITDSLQTKRSRPRRQL